MRRGGVRACWLVVVVATVLASTGCESPQQTELEVAVSEEALLGVSACPAGYNIIQGAGSNDTLTGTAGSDCILGNGGADTIYGLGGDDLLIGAPDADPAQVFNAGQVYIYRQTNGSWSEQDRLSAVENRAQARFGAALSAQGDWLAVVAPLEYQGSGPLPPNAIAYEAGLGAVHIFERKGDRWQWQTRLIPKPANEEDSVRLNGVGFVVYKDQTLLALNGLGRGVPYKYKQQDGSWQSLPGVNLPDILIEGGIVSADGQILLGSRFYDLQQPGFTDAIWSCGVVWIIDW